MKLLIILFLTSVIVSADDFLHRSYTCIKVAESNMLGNLKQTFNKESHILIHDMKNKKGFSYTLDNEKFTQIGQGNEFRTTNSNLFVSDYDHHYGDFLTIMLIQEGFVNDKKTKYTCIAKTSGYDLSQRGKTENPDLAKVKKLMEQEYMACVDTQTQTTKLYDGLKDKNLETYSELSQIKQYREALLVMVSTCQKVYAFHDEVEQGKKIAKLVNKAIIALESKANRNDWKILGDINTKVFLYKTNEHGVILKTKKTQELIYLGNECDAYSKVRGKGQWGFYDQSDDFWITFRGNSKVLTSQNGKGIDHNWHNNMKDTVLKCRSQIKKKMYLIENNKCLLFDKNSFKVVYNRSKEAKNICYEAKIFDEHNRRVLLHSAPKNNDFLADSEKVQEEIKYVQTCKGYYNASFEEKEENIVYVNKNIISLREITYSYYGGAHGISRAYFVNYYRENGSIVTWDRLFHNNKDMFNYVYNRVKYELASLEYLKHFDQFEMLKYFTKKGYFSIQNDGLYIQFASYDIAPYSDGQPGLLITKDVLQKHMTPKDYEYYFLNPENVRVSDFCNE